ncbi:MAG: hypothetical protein HY875_16485 [Chloroflexi bacterium]|nr:hypothetical protein [Chloroflexota bacterium]
MLFRALPFALGATLLFAACGSGTSYNTDRDFSEDELEAMALTDDDMPAGVFAQDATAFTNEDWAAEFPSVQDEDGLALQATALDSQGRVAGFRTILAWDSPIAHLGHPYLYRTHSTVFSTVEKAREAIALYCDLPIDETNPLKEFAVPKIGEESVGLQVAEELPDFGTSVDTIVCFRTGRIVHSVVQSGLEGTSDISLSVRLAERMLAHVDAVLAGEAGKTP